MKAHQTGQGRRVKPSGRKGASETPIRHLQRRAGNRAVAAVLETAVQRTTGAAASTRVSPFELGVMEPFQKAIAQARTGKRKDARQSLKIVGDSLMSLSQKYSEKEPALSEKLRVEIMALRQVYLELQPRPIAKIADEMTAEIEALKGLQTEIAFATRRPETMSKDLPYEIWSALI